MVAQAGVLPTGFRVAQKDQLLHDPKSEPVTAICQSCGCLRAPRDLRMKPSRPYCPGELLGVRPLTETTVRLLAFGGIFAAMAVWEVLAPRRLRALPRAGRWFTNWGLSIANAGLVAAMKVVLGAAAVLAALDAAERGFGLFHALDWPAWMEVALAFLILDVLMLLQNIGN